MNDRPLSGQYPDFGYDGLSTTTFAGDSAYAPYESQGQGYNYGATYGSYDTGSYDTTAWAAPQNGYAQPSVDGYTHYDGYLSTVPTQAGVSLDYQSAPFGYETPAEQTGHWSVPGYGTETGAYDATAWNTASEQTYGYGGYDQQQQQVPEPAHEQAQVHEQQYAYDYGYEVYAASSPEAEAPVAVAADVTYTDTAVFDFIPTDAADLDADAADGALAAVHDLPTQAMPVTPAAPAEPRPRAAPAPSPPRSPSPRRAQPRPAAAATTAAVLRPSVPRC